MEYLYEANDFIQYYAIYYMKYIGMLWSQITPEAYASILSLVALIGWFMMKSGPRSTM